MEDQFPIRALVRQREKGGVFVAGRRAEAEAELAEDFDPLQAEKIERALHEKFLRVLEGDKTLAGLRSTPGRPSPLRHGQRHLHVMLVEDAVDIFSKAPVNRAIPPAEGQGLGGIAMKGVDVEIGSGTALKK